MFIFAHIFAGSILGLALCWILKDTRIIPFCIAGAILPDLIDKPLGYLLLPQAIDSGRTYFHSLIAVCIIIAIAAVALRYRRTFIIFALAGAVLLHQILDSMWHEPVTWFYPLFGRFPQYHYVNYFTSFFWLEILSASEWIFLFATVVLLSFVFMDAFRNLVPPYIQCWQFRAGLMVLLLLFVLGVFSLLCGFAGTDNMMAPYNTPESDLIQGGVSLLGCVVIFKITESRHPPVKPGILQSSNEQVR
jgi:membrane-bound metal-dependent hydrolase YbcI (DUF457 family)